MSPERSADYGEYREREGQALTNWATWCVLAEQYGPDWRAWPAGLQRADSETVTMERGRLAREADFHAWLQWLASGQVAQAQEAARDAGMDIGIIQDLAVGAHPGGADAWSDQDLSVPGVTVGAPPDEFNQRGQDWGSQPWHPERLAARRYQPLADLIAAAVRSGGALRMDHVMGLSRLVVGPAGHDPGPGSLRPVRSRGDGGGAGPGGSPAGVLAIGEDLGTVDPWIRDYLAAHGILGTSMLWFERRDDGTPLPPGDWRRNSLAAVGTHDMPPAGGVPHRRACGAPGGTGCAGPVGGSRTGRGRRRPGCVARRADP